MGYELLGYDLEDPLPLIGISIWNILMFILALIIGLVVVRIVEYSGFDHFLRLEFRICVNPICRHSTGLISVYIIVQVQGSLCAFYVTVVGHNKNAAVDCLLNDVLDPI